MIANQMALVRRELWEHRSIYVTPFVIGVIIVMMAVTGHVAISTMDQAVDIALLGASNLGENERAVAINVMLISITSVMVLAMWVLTVFYSLDSLYAERKDRSILFWRSMPTTDAETVIAKLLTAIVVIPLVTFAVIAATHLLTLIVSSIWVAIRGANAAHLIWAAAPLLDNWVTTLIVMLALPLWLSPLVGWFLLVSAYTKRSPLLMAFLPIVLLPMLEKSLIGTSAFADAIFVRSGKMPLFKGIDAGELFESTKNLQEMAHSGISLISIVDVGRFLTSPGLWLGLIVCGLFTTAAIYVRRYRDDS